MKLWPKTFKGVDIREVWDFRLSTAVPQINREGGTWVVYIYAKDNADYIPGQPPVEPLDTYDTGIQSESGDQFDTKKIKVCYKWLYSQRDKYSKPNIENLKPHVAKINTINDALNAAMSEAHKGYSKALGDK
jgi:hypothetical protein